MLSFDGKVYNLNDVESCKTLVVPKFAFQNGGLPKVTYEYKHICTGKPVSLKKYMQIMGFKRIKK